MMDVIVPDHAKAMFDALDLGLPWPPPRPRPAPAVDPRTEFQPLAVPSSNRKSDALAKALRRRARSA